MQTPAAARQVSRRRQQWIRGRPQLSLGVSWAEHFLEGTGQPEPSPHDILPRRWASRASPYLHTVCILFGVMQRMENHPQHWAPKRQSLKLCSHLCSREKVLPMDWACLEVAAAVKVATAAGTGLTKQETFTCDSHTEGQSEVSVKARATGVFSGEPPSAPPLFHSFKKSWHNPALWNPPRKCHGLPAMVGRGHATQAGSLDPGPLGLGKDIQAE